MSILTTVQPNGKIWFLSLTGGVISIFFLLLFLVLVQQGGYPAPQVESNRNIELIDFVQPESEQEIDSVTQNPAVEQLIPPVVENELPQIDIQEIPIQVDVQLSQMLEKRFTLNEFATPNHLYGVHGFARLADVDKAPATVYMPPGEFPYELISQGILSSRLKAIVEIDEKGRARVHKIIYTEHPETTEIIVQSIEQGVYEIPKRHGEATKVILSKSIVFAADSLKIELVQKINELDLPDHLTFEEKRKIYYQNLMTEKKAKSKSR